MLKVASEIDTGVEQVEAGLMIEITVRCERRSDVSRRLGVQSELGRNADDRCHDGTRRDPSPVRLRLVRREMVDASNDEADRERGAEPVTDGERQADEVANFGKEGREEIDEGCALLVRVLASAKSGSPSFRSPDRVPLGLIGSVSRCW